MTIYQLLVQAGVKTNGRYSDLYFELTDVSREVCKQAGRTYSTFRSNIDGEMWGEIPFCYDPYWEACGMGPKEQDDGQAQA